MAKRNMNKVDHPEPLHGYESEDLTLGFGILYLGVICRE